MITLNSTESFNNNVMKKQYSNNKGSSLALHDFSKVSDEFD